MNVALILAGGTGNRMGSDCPKQLMPLCDMPVICHSLNTFQQHDSIDAIFVVCNKNSAKDYDFLYTAQYSFTKLQPLVCGGDTRKQSSNRGLLSIKSKFGADCIVLIHDAARPFVSDKIISDNIDMCKQFGACTTAIPATDTLLISHDGSTFDGVSDRNLHYFAQTPQTFKLAAILSAHQNSHNNATDDTTLLLEKGMPVHIVMGSKQNIKLTTPDDFALAKSFLITSQL